MNHIYGTYIVQNTLNSLLANIIRNIQPFVLKCEYLSYYSRLTAEIFHKDPLQQRVCDLFFFIVYATG